MNFCAFVLNAAAIFFDDRRKSNVWPLVGGKALLACAALAAAEYEICVLRYAGFYDLGFKVATKRTFHGFKPRFSGIFCL